MAGQVMEQAPLQQQASISLGQLQANWKSDHTATTTMAATMPASGCAHTTTTAAAEMAYLRQLQQTAAEANNNNGGGSARGEQCPRCASHDTKFCYYNNYNTSQPRHFCRACRRYWTLGGSLRNVPIGGSTRKRPRPLPHHPMPPARRHHVGSPPQGLLGSLFALGAAPLLEGRGGFDLGLGLPMPGAFGGAGEMHGLGLSSGLDGTTSSALPLLWPAGLLDNDSADAWKMPSVSAAMWPEFSAAPATPQAGALLHGGSQLM
jgi:hypothetical protein